MKTFPITIRERINSQGSNTTRCHDVDALIFTLSDIFARNGIDTVVSAEDLPSSEDSGFLAPLGTIRACRGCACLVAGGPTVCLRCIQEGK